MAYFTKWILIGSLASLGLLAANCQDFLGVFCQNWFSWMFRRKRTKRGGKQGSAPERARRTHSTQPSPEMYFKPFEATAARPNSPRKHRNTNPGRRPQ